MLIVISLSSRNNLVTVVVPLLQAIQKHTGGYYQVFAGWPKGTPTPGEEQTFGVKLSVQSLGHHRLTFANTSSPLAFPLEQKRLNAKHGWSQMRLSSKMSLLPSSSSI